MGLLNRLLGRGGEQTTEDVYECTMCGATYDVKRKHCEKCANAVRKVA